MNEHAIFECLNRIGARYKTLVGLTIAEPMPRTAIILKNMLGELPLLKQ